MGSTSEPRKPDSPCVTRAAAQWMPIATAPNDGTLVDLLFAYPRGRQIDCYWSEKDQIWQWREPTWRTESPGGLLPEKEWKIGCYPNMQPTHWMRPPALPILKVAYGLADAQIKHMVDRFLGWRLPENFNPDCGISFKAAFNENTRWPSKHEPTGTNLFDWTQADAMVRYMIEGMPLADKSEAPTLDAHEPSGSRC